MKFYSTVIKQAVDRNNSQIYAELKGFITQTTHQQIAAIKSQRVSAQQQSSQVPTCLVITTSESASSVDRQFQSVCE